MLWRIKPAVCVAKLKTFATRKKALYHKELLLFLAPLALNAAVSKNRAVENDRDTPESGRHARGFLRSLGGCNAPQKGTEEAAEGHGTKSGEPRYCFKPSLSL
jgi:hypothetical protein